MTISDTPHYQQDVPFEVPSSWVWCCITEVTNKITDGTHNSPINTPKGEYKYVTAKNIKSSGVILDNITFVSKEVHQEIYSRCNPEKGDILYIKDGATTGIATVNTLDEPFSLLSSVALIKPSHWISNKYLLYYLQSSLCYSSVRETMKGVGITRITLKLIEKWQIPLPPFAEQKRIAIEIEHWFALIDQIEQGKADLQTTIKHAKSKILDLAIHGKLVPQDPNDEPAIELLKRINPDFTPCDNGHYTFKIPNSWTWCKLGDIAQSNIGLTYKPTDITDNGIPVYRSNNIRDRKIDKSDLVRVNAPILEKQFLNIGDLLICARNGSRRLVGKCAIIEELDEVTSFGAFMAVCRSEYNQWIFNLLNTTYFDRYLDDSNSTAINQVTQRMLLALHIPLPPLSEQQRIVQKIEELFSVLDNIQNALEV